MNTWKKVGDLWCVVMDHPAEQGLTVTVTKSNGQTKEVTLGAPVAGRVNTFTVAPPAPRATESVGDLTSILTILGNATAAAKARGAKRNPAIVIRAYNDRPGFRVSVAGNRAKYPGSLTLTSAENPNGDGRAWFGRITLDGQFQPSREAPQGLSEVLKDFAKDPAKMAAEHGHITHHCCFCNHPLTDPRSKAVGYGPDCADNYGLPWGVKGATTLAAEMERYAAA